MTLSPHLPSFAKVLIQNPLARLSIMAAITSTLVFSAYVTKAHAQNTCANRTSCYNSCSTNINNQLPACYNQCSSQNPNNQQAIQQCDAACQAQASGEIAQCQSQCNHVPCP